MELFPLSLGKEIKKLDIGCNKLMRASKDRIFTEVDPIFINLQALFSGGDNKTMLRKLRLLVFNFLFSVNHLIQRINIELKMFIICNYNQKI